MKAGVGSTSGSSSWTTSGASVVLAALFGVAAAALPGLSCSAVRLCALSGRKHLCRRGVSAGFARDVGRRRRSYSRYFADIDASFLMSSRLGFFPPFSAAKLFSHAFKADFNSATCLSKISLPLAMFPYVMLQSRRNCELRLTPDDATRATRSCA